MSYDLIKKPIEFDRNNGNIVKCTLHRKKWSSAKCKKCTFYHEGQIDKGFVWCEFPDPEDMAKNIT